MKLFLLTALTMVAFAANSVLNRLALLDGSISPASFASLRVCAGVVVLIGLMAWRSGLPRPGRPDFLAVGGLAAYMLGFSFAYVSMDAGLGALFLFGGVQITMFIGALWEGDAPPWQRWAGMILAMGGLAVLSVPNGPVSIPLPALGLMGLAAVGWGIYSLLGRGVRDPLRATTWNFAYCLPIVLLVWVVVPGDSPATYTGITLAVISGGITSALGYALWYAILPQVGATKGALSQLSAPVIALVLGAAFLGEAITMNALMATVMILGGIALGLLGKR